jgi:YHS domain-containing protein
MPIDPVCGTQIEEKTSTFKSRVKEKEIYFCGPTLQNMI